MVLKRKYMLNLIFLIGLIGVFLYFQNWTNKFEKRLLKDGKFAIGTFTKHIYPLGRSYSNKYEYSFSDDSGNNHSKGDSKNLPKGNFREEVKEGDQFLVLYNEDGSDIYFDRPIKDSTDFKRYIKEFEEMRKQKK